MSGCEMPDRANAVPVFRQLYVRYRDAISSGQLKPGDRVPSVRALASELNLARGTVEAAYQLLIGEGYLEARGPAGTIVCPQLSTPTSSIPPALPAPAAYNGIHTGRAPLPLQMGLPALDAFPRKTWTRLASRAIQQGGLDGMIYPNPQGDEALRVALTRYLAISRGIACTPDQVFICSAFGLAPHAYLIQLRLAKARQQLARGDSPADVACALGFADQSHLGRWFRRAYQLTPADYRRRCSKLPD